MHVLGPLRYGKDVLVERSEYVSRRKTYGSTRRVEAPPRATGLARATKGRTRSATCAKELSILSVLL